jgi:cell division protein FtsI/penicillin-binding protein 2
VENGDFIFPESEGREGIEQAFDFQLRGEPGRISITYDANEAKIFEQVISPPVPGYNVVTTLDSNLQKTCEKVLNRTPEKAP